MIFEGQSIHCSLLDGDEFAVLVEAFDNRGSVTEIARRLIDAVCEPFVVDGESVTVGVSLGIAVYPDDGTDVKTILQAADRAMYSTKIADRNSFEFTTLAASAAAN